MMESEVTGNCHASFGERDRETRKSKGLKVRSVPTLFSPLLANIALHGMEEFLSQFVVKIRRFNERGKVIKTQTKERYGFVRFADDFIITARNKEDIDYIKPYISGWLKDRGLELNQDKTRIVNIEDSFNFLGFNIRQASCLCRAW